MFDEGEEWKREKSQAPKFYLHPKEIESLISIDKKYAHDKSIVCVVPEHRLFE